MQNSGYENDIPVEEKEEEISFFNNATNRDILKRGILNLRGDITCRFDEFFKLEQARTLVNLLISDSFLDGEFGEVTNISKPRKYIGSYGFNFSIYLTGKSGEKIKVSFSSRDDDIIIKSGDSNAVVSFAIGDIENEDEVEFSEIENLRIENLYITDVRYHGNSYDGREHKKLIEMLKRAIAKQNFPSKTKIAEVAFKKGILENYMVHGFNRFEWNKSICKIPTRINRKSWKMISERNLFGIDSIIVNYKRHTENNQAKLLLIPGAYSRFGEDAGYDYATEYIIEFGKDVDINFATEDITDILSKPENEQMDIFNKYYNATNRELFEKTNASATSKKGLKIMSIGILLDELLKDKYDIIENIEDYGDDSLNFSFIDNTEIYIEQTKDDIMVRISDSNDDSMATVSFTPFNIEDESSEQVRHIRYLDAKIKSIKGNSERLKEKLKKATEDAFPSVKKEKLIKKFENVINGIPYDVFNYDSIESAIEIMKGSIEKMNSKVNDAPTSNITHKPAANKAQNNIVEYDD